MDYFELKKEAKKYLFSYLFHIEMFKCFISKLRNRKV